LRPKKCGAGAGWDDLRGGCWQNFSNSCGCGAGLNFAGAGADTKFQPAQDSNVYCTSNEFPFSRMHWQRILFHSAKLDA